MLPGRGRPSAQPSGIFHQTVRTVWHVGWKADRSANLSVAFTASCVLFYGGKAQFFLWSVCVYMFVLIFYALAGRSCWCASLSVRLLGLGSHTIHGCVSDVCWLDVQYFAFWGHRDVVFYVLNMFAVFVPTAKSQTNRQTSKQTSKLYMAYTLYAL